MAKNSNELATKVMAIGGNPAEVPLLDAATLA
jgi:hypothetical protein